MSVSKWMSWDAGVDLSAFTVPGLERPNLMICVAGMVHAPVASAPAGIVLWQPEARSAPELMGFVSSDERLARWLGPNLFAGSPFEHAPCFVGSVRVFHEGSACGARVEVEGHVFETTLSELGPLELAARTPGVMPFHQHALEAIPKRIAAKVDGRALDVIVPPQEAGAAPAACWTPTGFWSR